MKSAALHEKGYVFVKQGKPLICLQQNPIAFAALFFSKYKSLKLYTLGIKCAAVFKGVKAILRYHLWRNLKGREVWLPVFGHLAIKIHRGYKVFDVKRAVVLRVIDQNVESALVKKEITSVVSASDLEFAPKIYKYVEKQRWYEEEYIVGEQRISFEKTGSIGLFKFYRNEIEPCLKSMARLKSIEKIETKEYLGQVEKTLDDLKLFDTQLEMSRIEEIKHFVSINFERISDQAATEICIAFSHGDFSMVNILSTDNGIKVIDWEGAKQRSLLNDFFNFFLTEIYYNRAGVDIVADVNELGKKMLRSLYVDSDNTQENYDNSLQIYRQLYYVERIVMLLERDVTERALHVIFKSIEVFNRFERECRRF